MTLDNQFSLDGECIGGKYWIPWIGCTMCNGYSFPLPQILSDAMATEGGRDITTSLGPILESTTAVLGAGDCLIN